MPVSGSDTSAINKFRQGVNAFGNFERRSAMPVISPEADSAQLIPVVFGQPKTFSDNVPFQDLADFDPVLWLNDGEGTQAYPAFLGNVNLRDPGQMDGVLEPLGIRAKISMTSIDFPYESHDIRGSLQNGGEDIRGNTVQIAATYPIERPASIVPFFDADEYMGSADQTSIRIPSVFTDKRAITRPYDEVDVIEFDKLGVTITGADVIGALESMRPATDDLLPVDNRSAGTGYTYTNTVAGVDSLAFGGLKK
jgi:hypothetical protein